LRREFVTHRVCSTSAAVVVALLSCTTAHAEPEFVPLGFLPHTTSFRLSSASGISADGSTVIGISIAGDQGYTDGFRWTRAGGMVGHGMAKTGLDNFSAGASADGTYVTGDRSSPTGTQTTAFRHTRAGGATFFGSLPGLSTSSTIALDISGDGSKVVGQASGDSGNGVWRHEAYLWNNGTMTPLGYLPGGGGAGSSSAAGAISLDGTTIAGSSDSTQGPQAFRKVLNGGLGALGDLDGGTFSSFANGLSSDGNVVIGQGTSALGKEAFRWSGGTMTGLGDLPGGPYESEPRGVSGDGSIVVGYSATGGTVNQPINSPFIWDAEHGMRNLQTVLTEMGLDLTGWSLRGAGGISADGTMIVGGGINPQGENEAFLVVIPEPGALALLALAAAGGLARRRRH
jgi:probable HAF family extracellular repeat protein